MPKGGDLHHHLTGAVYPEVLIQLASYEGLSVDLASSAFAQCEGTPPGSSAGIPVSAMTADCKACADSSVLHDPRGAVRERDEEDADRLVRSRLLPVLEQQPV